MKQLLLIGLLCSLLGFGLNAQSPNQQHITVKSAGKIKGSAKILVEEFQQLLTTIATDGVEKWEVDTAIVRSFNKGSNQLFATSEIMVEDDIDRNASATKFSSKTIERYLKDFDIFYSKADTSTIVFSNVEVSNVKQGKEYKYVKISFDCERKGVHKNSNLPLTPVKRVAEIRADSIKKEWVVQIVRLSYFNTPFDDQNDLALINENSGDTTSLKDLEREMIAQAVEEYRSRQTQREQEAKKLIDEADQKLGQEDYKNARSLYAKAREVAPSYETRYISRQLRRIAEIEEEISTRPLRLFKEAILKGKNSERLRKYPEARKFFEVALTHIPDIDSVKRKIEKLNLSIRILTAIDAKTSSNNIEKAIEDCDSEIKTQRRSTSPNIILLSDLLVRKAVALRKQGDSKQSKKVFEEAIKQDANNSEAFRQRGLLAYSLGQTAEALADFTVYLNFDEKNIVALLDIARCHVAVKDLNKSIEYFDKALMLSSLHEILYEKGLVYHNFEKPTEAIQTFTTLINRNHEKANSLYYRGLNYLRKQEIVTAAKDLRAAIKIGLSPEQNTEVFNIANQFVEAGKQNTTENSWEEAIENFDKAILFWDKNRDAWYQKALAHFKIEEFEEAQEALSTIIQVEPNNSDLFYQRGLSYFFDEEYNDAIQDFDIAYRLSNSLYIALVYKGDAHVAMQQYSLAEETFSEALRGPWIQESKNYTERSIVLAKRATAYLKHDKYKEAEDDFEESLRYNRNNAETYYLRGQSYLAQRQYRRAVSDFIEAEEKGYDKGKCFYSKGDAYRQNREYKRAVSAFTEALKREEWNDNRAEAHRWRAYSLFKLNMFGEAITDYEIYQESEEGKKGMTNHEIETEMAIAYLETTQVDTAFGLLNNITKQKPTYAEGLFVMGYYYFITNKPDDATNYFNRVASQSINLKTLNNSIVEVLLDKRKISDFIKKIIK
jgi:tetratricopeptide (TPR) repeat protein